MSIFDLDEFDAFAASLGGGWTLDQWDARVAKVGDKVFAILGGHGRGEAHIEVKIEPGEFDFLTALPGITQAPYFARGHWVSISEGGALPEDEVRACITDSWALVAAKLTRKTRAEIGIVLPGRD